MKSKSLFSLKSFNWILVLLIPCPSQISFAEMQKSAQYLVPSVQASEPSQVYETQSAGITLGASRIRMLHFKLPPELAGANPRDNVMHEETSTVFNLMQFQSEKMNASCVDSASRMSCLMQYKFGYGAENINSTAVKSFLTAKFGQNPETLKLKLEQAAIFEHDPQGVLVFFH
ncbi:MAG: hypothetical protein H7333_03030 [Bdellovibrionales bacterium]|nr:hypothetical protein [Oligoflexia bacterium]